jgi:hypothetical protein
MIEKGRPYIIVTVDDNEQTNAVSAGVKGAET